MKTALVTGAARGIGRATAVALAAAGVRVYALDRDFPEPLPGVETLVHDLMDLGGLAPLVASLGALDVLVNNAGVQPALPIDQYTDEARKRVLRVNLEAPVELIRAAGGPMKARRAGRIINLTSVAAYGAHTDIWYAVTKAGIVSFTRSFAAALGPHGIQVNAVAPGPVDTELMRNAQPERIAQLMKAVYTRRAGRPDEIAEAIRWLALDAPEILNGAVLDITDGSFLR